MSDSNELNKALRDAEGNLGQASIVRKATDAVREIHRDPVFRTLKLHYDAIVNLLKLPLQGEEKRPRTQWEKAKTLWLGGDIVTDETAHIRKDLIELRDELEKLVLPGAAPGGVRGWMKKKLWKYGLTAFLGWQVPAYFSGKTNDAGKQPPPAPFVQPAGKSAPTPPLNSGQIEIEHAKVSATWRKRDTLTFALDDYVVQNPKKVQFSIAKVITTPDGQTKHEWPSIELTVDPKNKTATYTVPVEYREYVKLFVGVKVENAKGVTQSRAIGLDNPGQ